MRRSPLFRLPFLPLILAPLILLAPSLFTGKALFWGTPFLQFVPWRIAAWESLRAGIPPLWNPWVGMGAPLAANYQSALFYPPGWLLFLLSALGGVGWLAWGQALLVMLHMVWAGVGMAMLCRQIGLGKLAQTISGLAFALSGYLVARSGFLSINASVAWTPWIILLVSRLEGWKVESCSTNQNNLQPSTFNFQTHQKNLQPSTFNFSTLLLLSIAIALQLLAGHAQTAWYTLLLAGMWAAFCGWERGRTVNDRVRSAAVACLHLGLAAAFAIALAAVQLLPTAEYLQQSQRAGQVGYDFAMTYSFWPWRFLSLLAPNLFGSPAHGDYWGYGNFWEDALYLGILPLFMAISAGLALRRGSSSHRSSLVLFLLILTLISFALALGKNTPLYPWLYRNVPTFDMFQGPTRFSLWAEFSLCLLAGIGVDAWRRPVGRVLYWSRLGTAAGIAVTLGAGLTSWLMGSVSPTFIQAAASAGLLTVGCGLLSLLAPADSSPLENVSVVKADLALQATQMDCQSAMDNRTKEVRAKSTFKIGFDEPVWSWAVILFVACDLIIAGWGLNPAVDRSLYLEASRPSLDALALSGGSRLYLSQKDEYELKFNRFFQFKTFSPAQDWYSLREVHLPDSNILDHLPSANNFDPLLPARYSNWMEALDQASSQTRLKMLRLMGVALVEKVDSASPSGVSFERVEGGARFRWVSCARPADGSEALAQVLEESFDPDRQVVVEGLAGSQPAPCSAPRTDQQQSNKARILMTHEQPDRIDFQVTAGSAGWLELSDVWFPGWQARVDGSKVPLYRADYLFRAVKVEAGQHRVSFIYRPSSFYLGGIASLLAWFFAGLLWLKRSNVLTLKRSNVRTFKRLNVKSTFRPAFVTLILMGLVAGIVIASAHGDPLSLARLGTRYSQLDLTGTEGYDGQFVVYIAEDLQPASVAHHLDVPAYRYQRILLPLLARLLSFGNDRLLPWVIVLLGIAAQGAGTWAVAEILAGWGFSPWFALPYGLWAGFVLAVRLDLPEPLAYGLVAMAILSIERGKERLGWVLFGLALFAKEITILFIAAQILSDLIQRRWHAVRSLLLAAVIPFTLFQLWLWSAFGQPGIGSGGAMATPFEVIPYLGFIRIAYYSLAYFLAMLVVFGPFIVLPSIWGIWEAIKKVLSEEINVVVLGLLFNALAIALMPFSTFREPGGLLRFTCGLVLAVILFAARYHHRRGAMYSCLWIALNAFILKS